MKQVNVNVRTIKRANEIKVGILVHVVVRKISTQKVLLTIHELIKMNVMDQQIF